MLWHHPISKHTNNFFRCRTQLVSFMASCLGCPDMFDSVSASSVKDLFNILAEDTSTAAPAMMRDLVEELHNQEFLEQVALPDFYSTILLMEFYQRT